MQPTVILKLNTEINYFIDVQVTISAVLILKLCIKRPSMKPMFTMTAIQLSSYKAAPRRYFCVYFVLIVFSAQYCNKLNKAARPHWAQTLAIKERSVGGWNIWPESNGKEHKSGKTLDTQWQLNILPVEYVAYYF